MEERVELVCPYCGERVSAYVEPAEGDHERIEDCAVCCRPIGLRVTIDPAGKPEVDAHAAG